MEQTVRDHSQVLIALLPVSLCCLAKWPGTNSVEDILSVLHNVEFNNKTFRDLICCVPACGTGSEHWVKLFKKKCSKVMSYKYSTGKKSLEALVSYHPFKIFGTSERTCVRRSHMMCSTLESEVA